MQPLPHNYSTATFFAILASETSNTATWSHQDHVAGIIRDVQLIHKTSSPTRQTDCIVAYWEVSSAVPTQLMDMSFRSPACPSAQYTSELHPRLLKKIGDGYVPFGTKPVGGLPGGPFCFSTQPLRDVEHVTRGQDVFEPTESEWRAPILRDALALGASPRSVPSLSALSIASRTVPINLAHATRKQPSSSAASARRLARSGGANKAHGTIE